MKIGLFQTLLLTGMLEQNVCVVAAQMAYSNQPPNPPPTSRMHTHTHTHTKTKREEERERDRHESEGPKKKEKPSEARRIMLIPE